MQVIVLLDHGITLRYAIRYEDRSRIELLDANGEPIFFQTFDYWQSESALKMVNAFLLLGGARKPRRAAQKRAS